MKANCLRGETPNITDNWEANAFTWRPLTRLDSKANCFYGEAPNIAEDVRANCFYVEAPDAYAGEGLGVGVQR